MVSFYEYLMEYLQNSSILNPSELNLDIVGMMMPERQHDDCINMMPKREHQSVQYINRFYLLKKVPLDQKKHKTPQYIKII